MIQEQKSALRSIMDWFRESITVKLVFIGFLILVLLIPSSLIDDLIRERSGRQKQVAEDIASQWSGEQTVKGPVLVIPYRKIVNFMDDDNKQGTKEVIENLYILPDNLNIKAVLNPQKRHRGMFETVIYNSTIKVTGNFAKTDLGMFALSADKLLLDKARLLFSISDLKGLKTNPVITAAGMKLTAQPSFSNDDLFANGLQAGVNLSNVKDGVFDFNYTLELKGSQSLNFLHLGKTTDVEVSGKWQSPSFQGRNLPDDSKVGENGFFGKWHMLYYNRPYPQQWVVDNSLFRAEKKQDDASVGVKLILPVDQYQQITRTSKYAILIVLLTFVSLFLTEVIRKQRIHPFNYVLIGAAMIIYYILLLSFSEQVGYNMAYLVASVSTIALVSVFIASLLKNKTAAALFALILSVIYIFIFVIIQLEDLALMIGGIALFIITALLMYFSRKINWDKH
jgi:inner membrane protein